jgi:hypothetical protein
MPSNGLYRLNIAILVIYYQFSLYMRNQDIAIGLSQTHPDFGAVRDVGVAGSNPVIPTIENPHFFLSPNPLGVRFKDVWVRGWV